MTGPEHYVKAERLMESGSSVDRELAQVHATLALAAATFSAGMYADQQNCSILAGPQWLEVLS